MYNNILDLIFNDFKTIYEFFENYRHYLKLEQIVFLNLISILAGTKLSKMICTYAFKFKSIYLTLPDLTAYLILLFLS